MKRLLLLILLIIVLVWLWRKDFTLPEEPDWGVSYSPKFATELGLDWQEAYLAILDNLKIEKIRLATHWDDIELKKGQYDFSQTDWLVEEAQKRNVEVMLVVGFRTPRWPECHFPLWLEENQGEDFQETVLKLVKEEVTHFKEFENISSWQVENEPLLRLFGECPSPDKDLLRQEFELVKSLDDRPAFITDAGELSLWLRTPKFTDHLGTTMYTVVWNKYIGFFRHFYPPAWYAYRAEFARKFYKTKQVIISELQAEPWIPAEEHAADYDIFKQLESFTIEELEKNIELARRSGFNTAYLWGAEWWYWLKTEHNHPEYWEYIKKLIK